MAIEPVIALCGLLAALMAGIVGAAFFVGGVIGLFAYPPSNNWGFSSEHRYALFMCTVGIIQMFVGYIAYMGVVD